MEPGVPGQLGVERRRQEVALACHHDFNIDHATGPVDGRDLGEDVVPGWIVPVRELFETE